MRCSRGSMSCSTRCSEGSERARVRGRRERSARAGRGKVNFGSRARSDPLSLSLSSGSRYGHEQQLQTTLYGEKKTVRLSKRILPPSPSFSRPGALLAIAPSLGLTRESLVFLLLRREFEQSEVSARPRPRSSRRTLYASPQSAWILRPSNSGCSALRRSLSTCSTRVRGEEEGEAREKGQRAVDSQKRRRSAKSCDRARGGAPCRTRPTRRSRPRCGTKKGCVSARGTDGTRAPSRAHSAASAREGKAVSDLRIYDGEEEG